jgi:hypothetical protein
MLLQTYPLIYSKKGTSPLYLINIASRWDFMSFCFFVLYLNTLQKIGLWESVKK